MVQIAYKNGAEWPKDGLFRVNTQFKGEAIVPLKLARRRANGYLALNVSLFVSADEPILILGEYPIWRVSAVLGLRGFGNVGAIGTIDVDARTGKPVPLSEAEIEAMQDRANEIATRLTLLPEATS